MLCFCVFKFSFSILVNVHSSKKCLSVIMTLQLVHLGICLNILYFSKYVGVGSIPFIYLQCISNNFVFNVFHVIYFFPYAFISVFWIFCYNYRLKFFFVNNEQVDLF